MRWKLHDLQFSGVAGIFSGGGGGGPHRPLKGYHAAPRRGSGGRWPTPRTVAKFHFWTRCKVLESESSFQQYQHFSCPKNLFFLRKISKNRTYLTGISVFFQVIIWKFWIFMKPIRPEKWSVNSIIWLINLEWRGQEFFGGPPRPLKGYQAHHAGGPGSEGPLDDSEVWFCKTIQSLWKWIHFFKNVNIFLLQEIHFF